MGVKLTSPKETAKEDAMENVIVFIKNTLLNLVVVQIVLLSKKKIRGASLVTALSALSESLHDFE